ncbi:GatB/YqeY domain-containing protein [Desertihabitans aurantiacus]|uniref:GatB/YqeY domain-containing protein n=1 Tax=Desertihabitans aurantiacus TaxID=2282477 RepID=UPI001E503E66|nr:GatB/YqeY domain-containing protein [Desertihabitans aurantiacus]
MTDTLKSRIRADMTAAMKAREADRTRTLRSVWTAIQQAEVAGTEAVELTEEQTMDVIVREAKKRAESIEAYEASGREELAARERAEAEVLAGYLPSALDEQELSGLVAEAIAETGAAEQGMRAMGRVMGALTPRTKGRADGAAVAAEVKRQLQG